jgi:VWFA-related protein
MTLRVRGIAYSIISLVFLASTVTAQQLERKLNLEAGATIEVINRAGRITIEEGPSDFKLRVSGANVGEADLQIKTSQNGIEITVPIGSGKRVDLLLTVPKRSALKLTSTEGAIEASGQFASVEASTETGTISMDVPTEDLRYNLEWTESRPRYLADFELTKVKERSAGRFEIKGRVSAETSAAAKDEKEKVQAISLNLTTARGIILLNVPANEVNSDLRERPLTNAAKAIIRSGDVLLMDAIRRAAPKYFGDYSRTLPPIRTVPTFAPRSERMQLPDSVTKTALVRVTDLKNRAIAGLVASDFEVSESGRVREIVQVRKSEAPFNLVLLLDVSGSVDNYVDFIRKAARNFVNTVSPADRLAIIIFNEDVKVLSTFTTDKGVLSESLDTFDAGGGTAFYDALGFTVADTLRPLKGERTAIVILTDGDDNRSFLPFDSLAGSIQESGALIYPLYVPSGLIALASQTGEAAVDPLRQKYMALTAKSEGEGEKLAQISGGVYYPITQIGQIQKAYEDIVLQMRSAYEVTYRSAPDSDASGVSPKLKIRVKRENAFTAITSVKAN